MAHFIGKSGADAIAKALHGCCKIIAAYGPKLRTAVATAETGGVITSTQALAAYAFIDASSATCDVFELVAQNSGFTF